jgi:hypothetical protein
MLGGEDGKARKVGGTWVVLFSALSVRRHQGVQMEVVLA